MDPLRRSKNRFYCRPLKVSPSPTVSAISSSLCSGFIPEPTNPSPIDMKPLSKNRDLFLPRHAKNRNLHLTGIVWSLTIRSGGLSSRNVHKRSPYGSIAVRRGLDKAFGPGLEDAP